MSDDLQRRSLEWRGIEPGNECPRCTGSGVRWYSISSTWRGGMGAGSSTRDLCDSCWGSGDGTIPFRDLRKLVKNAERTSSQNAVRDLLRMADVLGDASEAVKLLASVIEGVSNGKYAARVFAKHGSVGYTAQSVASALAHILFEGRKP